MASKQAVENGHQQALAALERMSLRELNVTWESLLGRIFNSSEPSSYPGVDMVEWAEMIHSELTTRNVRRRGEGRVAAKEAVHGMTVEALVDTWSFLCRNHQTPDDAATPYYGVDRKTWVDIVREELVSRLGRESLNLDAMTGLMDVLHPTRPVPRPNTPTSAPLEPSVNVDKVAQHCAESWAELMRMSDDEVEDARNIEATYPSSPFSITRPAPYDPRIGVSEWREKLDLEYMRRCHNRILNGATKHCLSCRDSVRHQDDGTACASKETAVHYAAVLAELKGLPEKRLREELVWVHVHYGSGRCTKLQQTYGVISTSQWAKMVYAALSFQMSYRPGVDAEKLSQRIMETLDMCAPQGTKDVLDHEPFARILNMDGKVDWHRTMTENARAITGCDHEKAMRLLGVACEWVMSAHISGVEHGRTDGEEDAAHDIARAIRILREHTASAEVLRQAEKTLKRYNIPEDVITSIIPIQHHQQ